MRELLRFGLEIAKEKAEDPTAPGGEKSDLGRVEDFGGKVATEEAPVVSVRGRGDGRYAGIKEAAVGRWWRAGGEGGAELDERFVGESAVGDEDGGVRAEA